MERVEGLGFLRERPAGAADTLPGRLRSDVEHDREGARRSIEHVASDSTAPPPSATTAGSPPAAPRARPPPRAHESRALPVLEQLGDGRAGTRLDLAVEVDEAPAEASRSLAPEGRLAGAHEPGEREMAPERVRRTHLAAPSSSASRSHGTPPHRARSGS